MADSPDGILDTSFFIAQEQGRSLRPVPLPSRLAVSVVTLAELRLAVLNNSDPVEQRRRTTTFQRAVRMRSYPIDEMVAFHWATLRSAARSLSQSRINDLWIAATALALRVPVITQDTGFVRLSAAGGPSVILV